MMTNLFKYTLLIFLLSFAACSSDDDGAPSVPNGQPQLGDVLELTVSAADFVTDGAPDTRATDNGNKTTFENGDRVGIIILDKSHKPIYDNIPYKYDSSNKKWVFDSDNGKGGCYYDPESTTYIVYYPYSRAADGVTSVDDLKGKFAPRFDQSDIKDYRASDLMVWSSDTPLPSSEKNLNAELEHAFASVTISPIVRYLLDDGASTPCIPSSLKISDVNFTMNDAVYVPYQTPDGSLRCILPTGSITDNIRCFFTVGSKVYGNSINISLTEANTRYISAPEVINRIYTLADAKIGDFYCRNSDNNGYLIPGDVALPPEQQASCIGIVFKVGMDESDKLAYYDDKFTSVHGYVVALKDAVSDICEWGDREQATQAESVGSISESVYNGYKNTKLTIDELCGSDNWHLYKVFHAIINYNNQVKVPANSTDWYLPSLKQLIDVYNVNGSILSSKLKTYGKQFITSSNEGRYWSSTQRSSPDAWHVRFANGGCNVWSKGQKWQNDCYARAILTF